MSAQSASLEARKGGDAEEAEGDVLQPVGEVGQVAADEAAQVVARVEHVKREHLLQHGGDHAEAREEGVEVWLAQVAQHHRLRAPQLALERRKERVGLVDRAAALALRAHALEQLGPALAAAAAARRLWLRPRRRTRAAARCRRAARRRRRTRAARRRRIRAAR